MVGSCVSIRPASVTDIIAVKINFLCLCDLFYHSVCTKMQCHSFTFHCSFCKYDFLIRQEIGSLWYELEKWSQHKFHIPAAAVFDFITKRHCIFFLWHSNLFFDLHTIYKESPDRSIFIGKCRQMKISILRCLLLKLLCGQCKPVSCFCQKFFL